MQHHYLDGHVPIPAHRDRVFLAASADGYEAATTALFVFGTFHSFTHKQTGQCPCLVTDSVGAFGFGHIDEAT